MLNGGSSMGATNSIGIGNGNTMGSSGANGISGSGTPSWLFPVVVWNGRR
jgi:hypothetical protein